ncbi:hypothetical protein, variant, partial [Phytophthora nicotianae]
SDGSASFVLARHLISLEPARLAARTPVAALLGPRSTLAVPCSRKAVWPAPRSPTVARGLSRRRQFPHQHWRLLLAGGPLVAQASSRSSRDGPLPLDLGGALRAVRSARKHHTSPYSRTYRFPGDDNVGPEAKARNSWCY